MTSFWQAAKETLVSISAPELQEFLASERAIDVYGIGYFCHNYCGDVLLVANSLTYHERSYTNRCQKYGRCDEQEFKWDIGNWQYPAGIAIVPGQQSAQYREGWEPFREQIETQRLAVVDDHGSLLRDTCCEVLRRLIRAGVFGAATQSLGYTVMDIDDPRRKGWETKLEFDEFIASLRAGDLL